MRMTDIPPALVILLGALLAVLVLSRTAARDEPGVFIGERAFADLEQQVAFGPRVPDSQGHADLLDWAQAQLADADWEVRLHETEIDGLLVKNVIAMRSSDAQGAEWIVLGAHYDTRLLADQDPDPAMQAEPVPGANDGASGVAVLLELARSLPRDAGADIWIVLFDAEDGGRIAGQDWSLGSQAFVRDLQDLASGRRPDLAVVVDMVGDADLNIHLEKNSDPNASASIWAKAQALGYEEWFVAQAKYSMLDDHTSFLQAGIPAVLLIDFDYPYWHTVSDTPDKTSAASLKIVGDTLLAWLVEHGSSKE